LQLVHLRVVSDNFLNDLGCQTTQLQHVYLVAAGKTLKQ
jgi:hypothetical protein